MNFDYYIFSSETGSKQDIQALIVLYPCPHTSHGGSSLVCFQGHFRLPLSMKIIISFFFIYLLTGWALTTPENPVNYYSYKNTLKYPLHKH